MSSLTERSAGAAGSSGSDGGALTGTGALLRFMLRRDRVRFPAWVLGLVLFMSYFVTALPQIYATPEDIRAIAPLMRGPMGALFGGPGYGMDDPHLEHLLAGLYGVYILLGAGLMSVLTVIRHTRTEEHSGRAELIRSNVVGRHAQLTAALTLTALMNLVVVALIGVLMTGQGFDATGSWLFAVSVGAVGLSFAGVAATTAQLSEYPRAAAGAGGAALGAAFGLRALGDMTSEHGNALSWLSPIGWAQQTAPYVLDRWWPLLISVAFAALMAALGYTLSTRRDLAAGLVPPRPGPARAAPWLRGPLALAWRLHRAQVVGWTIALVIAGGAYGAFTGPALDVFDDAPEELLVVMGGTENITAGFLGVLALSFGLAVAVYAVLAAQAVRAEEVSGRAEPVLSTAVSRQRWLGTHLGVAAVGSLWLLVAAGLATGTGAALSVGDSSMVMELVIASVAFAPAVWVVLALGALLYGLAPRVLPAVWALVVYALVVGFFGPLLDLPDVAPWFSPFEHVGDYPSEPVAGGGLAVLTLLAAGILAAGLAMFRRRDILGTG
jgi:ABC-2 type transport system permease protein